MENGFMNTSGRDPQILEKQEQALRFDAFTQTNAICLGKQMIASSEKMGIPFAIIIELNGIRVVQYVPEGTGAFHLLWMESKLYTVKTFGKSTMRIWAENEQRGMKRQGGPNSDMPCLVCCGGGFPIWVNGVGLVGQIAVSGPGDAAEHDFIADSLKSFQSNIRMNRQSNNVSD